MDPPYRILFAALLGIGAAGFFSVLWVVPAYYKFIPRRLALATRTLYCAIGCGYIGLAYIVLRDARPLGAFIFAVGFVSTLNLIVLAVERPWSRRDRQSTTPPM
jgi:hypothetical protein